MHLVTLLSFSCVVIQCISCQFINYQQQAPTKTNACVTPSNTALVEHFFNLIFSEFHNQPPVCVCVQMCPDQPTYCYPNGCFKKGDSRKKSLDSTATVKYQPTAQVSPIQQDNTQPMSFLADGQSSYLDNLLSFKSVDAKHVPKYEDNNNGSPYKEMHRDPFKDRYQSIFKYKKTPKVHLRYNLREQVKHKKSDIIKIEKIDLSKTKWPAIVDNNKQYYMDKNNENKDKYFHVLENSGPHYPSKFFKRDVTKLFQTQDDSFEEVENNTEVVTFSLENLIENLIESSFGPLGNDTELDLNVNLDYAVANNESTVESTTTPLKRSVIDANNLLAKNTLITLNETTNVVSLNNTIENIDENRYHEDNDSKDQLYKNVFNDMIASLSKHIEKNNNSSIEMMEQVLGHRVEDLSSNVDIITETSTEPLHTEQYQGNKTSTLESISENTVLEITTAISVETTATATGSVPTENEMEREQINVMRKTHKRLLRKSINNKPN